MLRWIAARFNRGHPLARQLRSPKVLQRFIDGLRAREPLAALRAITAVFDAIPALGLEASRLRAALDACDQYAQRLCLVLTDGLLENLPKQIVSEPAWNTLLDYYRARERGYREILANLQTTLPGNEEAYAASVIMACRAANALSKRCVLLGMTYADPGQETWTRIGQLADECRVAARSVALTALYDDGLEQTSLERELLVTLMFQAAPIANLLPTQHRALDLLLRQHAQHFEIRNRFDATARPFVIESSANCKPARWLPGRKELSTMRFFGPGFAGSEILRDRDRLESTRKVPYFVEASRITVPLFRDLLDRLIDHWSLAPPARQHRRESSAGTILVARDLAHIHRLIGFSELARAGHSLTEHDASQYAVDAILRAREMPARSAPTTPSAEPSPAQALENLQSYEHALGDDATEPWTLVDSSNEGVGAESIVRGRRLTVGLLIAFRHPDSIDWKLATIRRLTRGNAARVRIGLETMDGRPHPVRLSLDRAMPAVTTVAGPALHYDAIKQTAGSATYLLVPPGVFGPGWRYTLAEKRRWDLIEVKPQIQSELDFERAEYSIVPTSMAA
ncbi:MAG: hypothetical protein EHM59_12305 [Betaproteobacteria bacterium]|nr:MAG: hypothetical protein EHM59_12305 [Betaproteobacteria bacterium]